MTAREKGHDSPSAVAQTHQHRQQPASRWTCGVLKTSHFNAHTPAHTHTHHASHAVRGSRGCRTSKDVLFLGAASGSSPFFVGRRGNRLQISNTTVGLWHTQTNTHTHACVRACVLVRARTLFWRSLWETMLLWRKDADWAKGLPAAHLTARPKSERRGVRASLAHETRWQGAAITQESILWSANLAGALRAVCSTISMIPGGNQKHFGNHPPLSLSVV